MSQPRLRGMAVALAVLASATILAQRDTALLIVNGKIVTVDDSSFTSRLGTIAQAMLVRDGRIVAVGSNADVQAKAGAGATRIDLRGRTVVPGLIAVHEHPYDWAGVNPHILKHVLNDDIVVYRFLEGTPSEQAAAFPDALRAAVAIAKPGQWVYVVLSLGKQYEHGFQSGMGRISPTPTERILGQDIQKTLLDDIAPANPVLVRDTFTSMLVNEKALAEIDKVFYQPDANLINRKTGSGGRDGGANFRTVLHDVILKDHRDKLEEIHRLELSWWAGFGMSTFASLAYTPSNIAVYGALARTGRMPVRSMWGWNWREDHLFEDPYVLNTLVFMQDLGTEFFWYGGAQGSEENGTNCSTLEPRVKLNPRMLACGLEPGTAAYHRLYKYIRNGGRMAIAHTIADRDIDHILDVIEKASRDAGMTLEQVRARRHGFDHLAMAPRPDQIPRLKELGMVTGGNAIYPYEMSPGVLAAYGEKPLDWMNPKKSLVDAGIHTGFEVDRPISGTSLTMFWVLARSMDRKAVDGKAYGISQKIGRELALKTITTWGAYYLMKEDSLGSLAPGKAADFAVLDRDYLTIPEADIEKLRVLMTVVGGRIVHLVPSLAKEVGRPAVGAQIELNGEAARW
jgi:predicted amidohydrolase YtcJ